MSEEPTKPILEQYDASAGQYGDFTAKVEGMVREMLQEAGVQPHTVTSRVKSRESLRGKLARPGREYSKLTDVTDVAGVRITTYFADDVDKVAEYIGRWFEVDEDNSTDRREILDPDRFGYLSMHHIVGFGTNRETLPEYGQYGGMKAEIQTRSILQHAWAEIEHDLGYKSREGVPREIRRRFSALAGLLEIADHEFRSLRDELREYERDVPERIEKDPKSVEIDNASLASFVQNSRLVRNVDNEIALLVGTVLVEDYTYIAERADSEVAKLRFVGIESIHDLANALDRNRSEIAKFADKWLDEIGFEPSVRGDVQVPSGSSVAYLAYLMAARLQDLGTAKQFVRASRVSAGKSDVDVTQLAQSLLRAYGSIDSS